MMAMPINNAEPIRSTVSHPKYVPIAVKATKTTAMNANQIRMAARYFHMSQFLPPVLRRVAKAAKDGAGAGRLAQRHGQTAAACRAMK